MNQVTAISEPILWLFVLLAYFLGSIPFGYLLVRLRGRGDIREIGSGNIGATNVARAAGWFTGVATLVLDAAKGYFAVWLMEHFSRGQIRFMMYAGLAAILGHLFPVWLMFSGGKGVATALGVFLKNMLACGGHRGDGVHRGRTFLALRFVGLRFRGGGSAAPGLPALRSRARATGDGFDGHAIRSRAGDHETPG